MKNTQVSGSCSQEVQKFSANGSSEIRFLTSEGDSGDTMCRVWVCSNDRWLPFVEAAELKRPETKIDGDHSFAVIM
jgi:hypothetical protein